MHRHGYRRGGGVSWSWNPLHTREVGETTVVVRCLLKEISLLSPSTSPAEPLARVAFVKESPPESAAAGEVIYTPHGKPLRRYFETAIRVR